MDPSRVVDRRRFLLLGGVLAAGSACSSADEAPTPGRRTPQTTASGPDVGTSAPTTTPPATPAIPDRLPDTLQWAPNTADLDPGVKAAAARVVEVIGTWRAGDGGVAAAARRLAAVGQDVRLGSASRSLITLADAATVEVIEAQYGGLLATTASVLVVCRQWGVDQAGHLTAAGTTVDVRLTKDAPQWRVTAVHPGTLPTEAQSISRPARSVLAEPRIELPPAARADVAAGHVHDSVLSAMLQLAETYRIGVSVVRCGHPRYIFGTDRVSDHARGRAFDTWRINGRPVVDPGTPRGLVTGYMEAAAAAGSYNIGGPYAVSSARASFFSDATHHDHVHAAFTL